MVAARRRQDELIAPVDGLAGGGIAGLQGQDEVGAGRPGGGDDAHYEAHVADAQGIGQVALKWRAWALRSTSHRVELIRGKKRRMSGVTPSVVTSAKSSREPILGGNTAWPEA